MSARARPPAGRRRRSPAPPPRVAACRRGPGPALDSVPETGLASAFAPASARAFASAFASTVALAFTLGLAFAAGLASPCAAQLPYRPALPWADALATPPRSAVHFEADLFVDGDRDWQAQRLGVTGTIARGGGVLFLRLPWCALDTGGLPVRERWPRVVGTGAPAGWPGEARSAGWGSPEAGWLGPARLPLLGRVHGGLAAALPAGKNALYPFASTAMPVTAQLRRGVAVGRGWELAALGGGTFYLGRGLSWMGDSAHPGTALLGCAFARAPASRRSVQVTLEEERGGGRRSSRIGLLWRIPAGARQALSLLAQRELASGADRPFAARWAVVWSAWSGSRPPAPDAVAK